MNVFANMFFATLIVVYIVDLSGWTDTWLGWLSRWLGHTVTSLRPFSCSQCMAWWTGVLIAAVTGNFILPVIAFAALCGFMAEPLSQLLLAVRDIIIKQIAKI